MNSISDEDQIENTCAVVWRDSSDIPRIIYSLKEIVLIGPTQSLLSWVVRNSTMKTKKNKTKKKMKMKKKKKTKKKKNRNQATYATYIQYQNN